MEAINETIRARSGGLTFEEFYEREFRHVYRAIWLSARNDDDALEATQEAFGRAFARWRSLRRHKWVTGWVITTAHNLLRRRGRGTPPSEVTPVATAGPTPEAIDLRRAMQRLPRRQREALVLFYIADLPVALVAESMSISDGTVKALLAQGRESLRKSLEVKHV